MKKLLLVLVILVMSISQTFAFTPNLIFVPTLAQRVWHRIAENRCMPMRIDETGLAQTYGDTKTTFIVTKNGGLKILSIKTDSEKLRRTVKEMLERSLPFPKHPVDTTYTIEIEFKK